MQERLVRIQTARTKIMPSLEVFPALIVFHDAVFNFSDITKEEQEKYVNKINNQPKS